MNCVNIVTKLPDGKYLHECLYCHTETILPVAQYHRYCLSTEPPEKIGDALKDIFTSIKVHKKDGCHCDEMIARMNALGVKGVELYREAIIASLKEGYELFSWEERLKGGLLAVWKHHVNPFDPWNSILNVAIELAKSRVSTGKVVPHAMADKT